MTVDERGSISLNKSEKQRFQLPVAVENAVSKDFFDMQKVNRKVLVLIRGRHLSRQISLAFYADSQQQS